jgi:hypothetical protein
MINLLKLKPIAHAADGGPQTINERQVLKISASMANGCNHDLLDLKIRNMLADRQNADLMNCVHHFRLSKLCYRLHTLRVLKIEGLTIMDYIR